MNRTLLDTDILSDFLRGRDANGTASAGHLIWCSAVATGWTSVPVKPPAIRTWSCVKGIVVGGRGCPERISVDTSAVPAEAARAVPAVVVVGSLGIGWRCHGPEAIGGTGDVADIEAVGDGGGCGPRRHRAGPGPGGAVAATRAGPRGDPGAAHAAGRFPPGRLVGRGVAAGCPARRPGARDVEGARRACRAGRGPARRAARPARLALSRRAESHAEELPGRSRARRTDRRPAR